MALLDRPPRRRKYGWLRIPKFGLASWEAIACAAKACEASHHRFVARSDTAMTFPYLKIISLTRSPDATIARLIVGTWDVQCPESE